MTLYGHTCKDRGVENLLTGSSVCRRNECSRSLELDGDALFSTYIHKVTCVDSVAASQYVFFREFGPKYMLGNQSRSQATK